MPSVISVVKRSTTEDTESTENDTERYGELWEDIHDHLVADSRAEEESVPLAVVKRRLARRQTRG